MKYVRPPCLPVSRPTTNPPMRGPIDTSSWLNDPTGATPSDCWLAPPFQPKGGGQTTGPDAKKGRTVVVSDVHIGNDARTCWYRSTLHGPYLAALLDYVIAHASGDDPVTKLVILGDLFDFWTYAPEVQPPTIEEIIKANKSILGKGGKLAQAVAAVNGNAVYLHGNHDIGVTQADLDKLPLGDHRLTLLDDLVVDDSGLVLTHGHLFTMFNAPDERYPNDVPVGHFVTRAIGQYLETTLAPGQTAADLSNQGSPYGFDLASFIPALWDDLSSPSVTSSLLDYIAARCGLSETAPIAMADGSTMTIADAKKKYDGLWDAWVARYGGGEVGETVAAKAAQADYEGTYIAWFSQKAAFDNSASGAVTGHTHFPKEGIDNSACLYVNCGFECPASPDIADSQALFTFCVVESDGTPHLWCVVRVAQGYCVRQVPNPPSRSARVLAVYGLLLLRKHRERHDAGAQSRHGHGRRGLLRHGAARDDCVGLDRPLLAAGPRRPRRERGRRNLRLGERDEAQVLVRLPDGIFPNYASGGSSFVASSGSPPQSSTPANAVPSYGHPLFVDFKVGDDSVSEPGDCTPGAWTPQSLLAQAVDAAGFSYDPRQDIIYSKMYPLQRHFGYAYGYDAAALAMNANIDCEPIFFDYAGKTWMIELWKGQYGLETGCEIGVYNRAAGSSSPLYALLDATVGQRTGDSNPEHNQFFDCVGDDELLLMSSTLHRKGKKLLCRGPERHWWLTGFKWGVYSETTDLTMDVSITCIDDVMTAAFVGALQSMGYTVQTNGNEVSFTFDRPTTHQPNDDFPTLVAGVRTIDQQIVSAYDSLGLTSNDPNTVGDQAAATIGQAFAIYGEEFFESVLAHLASQFGSDLTAVVNALTQEFGMAVSDASQLVSNAGYTLASWVSGIGNLLSEAIDFSCVVEVGNGPYELSLDSQGTNHGGWAIAPPDTIPAGGVGRFWLKPDAEGSDGWARYAYVDSSGKRTVVELDFTDPVGFWESNTAGSWNTAWSITNPLAMTPFTFYTKSGDVGSAWSAVNDVVTGGHPFYVAFVWGSGSPP